MVRIQIKSDWFLAEVRAAEGCTSEGFCAVGQKYRGLKASPAPLKKLVK